MKQTIFPLLQIGLCTCAYLSATSGITLAQVTSDNTVNTKVNQNENVAEITGGTTRGDNLFHSFREFSVRTGNEAFFNNADSISNIFSRVTGGNISTIDGLIRANGSASLFLINPAGIIFGEGARLDIGGSFLGSSASSILFEDGEFSAADLENPPLLTVNAPIGLGFRDNPGNIENRSVGQNPNGETNITGGAVGLQVPNGETLAIVGGNVLLDDGNLTAKGGHIEIGSVLGEREVGISETDIGFALDYDSINSFGDITLQNTAVVDVTASGGGSINVNGNNLTISNSSLNSGIASNLNSSEAQAGNITINATKAVKLNNSGNINNEVNFGIGNAGNIEINTGSLSVIDGGFISASTSGRGDGGRILINAGESVVLEKGENNNFTSIYSNVESSGIGNSGGVNITAEFLEVNRGAQIQSIVSGRGNSGKIIIDSSTVSLDGRSIDDFPSGAFSLVTEGGIGNAGGLEITANSFLMTNRAQILSNTAGMGNAGNVNILVEDEVNLVNSSILAEVTEGTGMGEGGDINITTNSFIKSDPKGYAERNRLLTHPTGW